MKVLDSVPVALLLGLGGLGGCGPVSSTAPPSTVATPDLQLSADFPTQLDRGFACEALELDGAVLLDAHNTLRMHIETTPDGARITVFLGTRLDSVFDDDNCDGVASGDWEAQSIRMAYGSVQGRYTRTDQADGRVFELIDVVLAPDAVFAEFADYDAGDVDLYEPVVLPDTVIGPIAIGGALQPLD